MQSERKNKSEMVFQPQNYKLLIIGLAIMVLGFVVMTLETEEYGFGFLGLTAGPIILTVSFIFQFYTIFAKPKSE